MRWGCLLAQLACWAVISAALALIFPDSLAASDFWLIGAMSFAPEFWFSWRRHRRLKIAEQSARGTISVPELTSRLTQTSER